MKNCLLFFVIIALFNNDIHSQTINDTTQIKTSGIRISCFLPGVLYEKYLNNNISILFDFGTDFSIAYDPLNHPEQNSRLFLNPFSLTELRLHPTFLIKSKNNRYSCIFIALQSKIKYMSYIDRCCITYGSVIGYQRIMSKWFYYIDIGCGWTSEYHNYYHKFYTELIPLGNLGIGINLN